MRILVFPFIFIGMLVHRLIIDPLLCFNYGLAALLTFAKEEVRLATKEELFISLSWTNHVIKEYKRDLKTESGRRRRKILLKDLNYYWREQEGILRELDFRFSGWDDDYPRQQPARLTDADPF